MKTLLKLAAIGIVSTAALASPAFAALKVGAKAPEFSATAYLAGKSFTYDLADALKGCNVEAHLFSQAIDQFTAEGATVIGVTAGNLDQLAQFSNETEYCSGKFPVAADEGAKIAKQYDSILPMKPDWANRTSYVISPQGTIVKVYSDLSPEHHVQETLDAVKAIKK